MVRGELIYNPYLMETKVKFNGQDPKINSLVEKYKSGKLQSWVAKLPIIFYNEMNGYDFDLDFTGTKTDYDDLEKAFVTAGVGVKAVDKLNGETQNADVRLFFKNELEGPMIKSEEIDSLLDWLDRTQNRRFANSDFRNINSELFEDAYTYILIKAPNVDNISFEGLEVTMENMTSINELPSDLTNTPVLFYIDALTKPGFRVFLETVMARKDVIQEQLFFLIHPDLNEGQIQRTIQDLGIGKPQIVQKIDADKVRKFFEIYPVTEYVHDSIKVFRSVVTEIASVLEAENNRARIQNQEVYRRIEDLEDRLQRLKDVNEQFLQKDNMEYPSSLNDAKASLSFKIQNWRKKKSKIGNDDDAAKAANEFSSDLKIYFEDFVNDISKIFNAEKNEIATAFKSLYGFAEIEDGYFSKWNNSIDFSPYSVRNLANEFLSFRVIRMVEQPDYILGLAKRLWDKQEPKTMVEEITYSLSKWRQYADENIEPVADKIILTVFESLLKYYELAAQDYQQHLALLLTQNSKEKEDIAAQLSSEEQKLQTDINWLEQFEDQLKVIERG